MGAPHPVWLLRGADSLKPQLHGAAALTSVNKNEKGEEGWCGGDRVGGPGAAEESSALPVSG